MMTKLRGETKPKHKLPITFQAIDWKSYNIDMSNDDDSEDSGKKKFIDQSEFLIRLFGVTEKSESVCINITGFRPYFFVKLPNTWSKKYMADLEDCLKEKVWKKHKESIISVEMVEKKDLYMFTNSTFFKFAKITTLNYPAMKACEKVLKSEIRIRGKQYALKLYESNIDPMIRFIHEANIKPSGWVKVNRGCKSSDTRCQLEWTISKNDIEPIESIDSAPLIVASFDIECTSEDGSFPKAERDGDKIIQIGTTVNYYGSKECFYRHIITVGSCKRIPGAEVECYKKEKDALIAWTKFIQRLDPDIITGYNIWGFDLKYMYDRAVKYGFESRFCKLGRVINVDSIMEKKQLSSSGLGDNFLNILHMDGRVQIDLMKLIQKDYKLEMYKLDFVASWFMKGGIQKTEVVDGNLRLYVKSLDGINVNNHISISINGEKIEDDKKYAVVNRNDNEKWFEIEIDNKEYFDYNEVLTNNCEWCENKVDLPPKELFKKFCNGSTQDIKDIAVYCIQDCELCNRLINKLEVITNNIGMANVCYVPFSWLFMRGQGVKLFSLVSRQCRLEDFLVPVVRKPEVEEGDEDEEDSYEGAIVLVATPGIYFDPISVMDYASLYPSSMISENISHDSLVWVKSYDYDGNPLPKYSYGNEKYDNLPDFNYWNIKYDLMIGKKDKKRKIGIQVCRYAEHKDGTKNIIPRILQGVLGARKATRKKQAVEPDPFKKSVLEGLQLAYKVTANSLYGQVGASTSPICLKELAASTTATGRRLLKFAKDHTEEQYPGAECIYGDTDSIFVNFSKYWENVLGLKLEGKEALQKSIDLGIEAGRKVSDNLKAPHDLEYEKTFYPFIQLAKKRYIGNLYGTDTEKFYQNNMGVVLKRRDNAAIAKEVYGGIVNILLNKRDIPGAIKYFRGAVRDILDGKVKFEKLVITKSLRAEYANPERIAHKALADRMGERDPGNKPGASDRIPFIYIETEIKKGQKVLQGDKVEHPQYIKDKGLKPDFLYYIERQIKVPCCQIFALILEKLDGYNKDWLLGKNLNVKDPEKKMQDLRQEETANLLLGDILRKNDNRKKGNIEITSFFKTKPVEEEKPLTGWKKRKAEIETEGSYVKFEETKKEKIVLAPEKKAAEEKYIDKFNPKKKKEKELQEKVLKAKTKVAKPSKKK